MKRVSFLLIILIAGALFAKIAAPASASDASQNRNSAPPASSTEAAYRAAADSADKKFRHIQTNATKAQPDEAPTVFTEREVNAYVADSRVELPKGIKRVRFSGANGVVTTDSTVDFDQVTAGARSSNPLLSLFSGVHQVQIVSHAQGSGGEGHVQIDSVSIDGVEVPRIALEYFVDRYIKPRYPDLGMQSRFRLPARVDTAVVGDHVLTVTQK